MKYRKKSDTKQQFNLMRKRKKRKQQSNKKRDITVQIEKGISFQLFHNGQRGEIIFDVVFLFLCTCIFAKYLRNIRTIISMKMGGKYSCIKIEIGNHSEISCFCRLRWSTNCNPSQYLHFRLQSCYPFGRINISTKTSTAFDKATSVYVHSFFHFMWKSMLFRQGKITKSTSEMQNLLKFRYSELYIYNVDRQWCHRGSPRKPSHCTGGISWKLVKPPLIY